MSKSQTNTRPGSPQAKEKPSLSVPWYKNEERISWLLLLVILITVYAIRDNFRSIPFERDEGIYSYIGQLILEGKTPYKDFYEQKFPGLFYFYGAMVAIAEDTVEGMHMAFTWLNLLSIVSVFFAARILFSPFAGVIAATTFAFVSLTANLSGFTVQSEHGVAFFISLGLLTYALYLKKRKLVYAALMGISLGLAFMTKTSGVFLLVWGGLALMAEHFFNKEKNYKALFVATGIYTISALLVVGFFFALMAIQGVFGDMMYWAYEVPKNYVGKIGSKEGMQYFRFMRDAIVENHKFFWIHGLLALGVVFLKPVRLPFKISALLLAAFSFATIVPGFYFYGHYWIQIIPGLSFLSGLAFWGLSTTISARLKWNEGRVRIAYLAVFAVLVFSHLNKLKNYYYHPNYERILRSVYGNNPFPESMEIANFIKANSAPEDHIALIGSEPQIYFYTNKKSPSRHAYFAAIVSDAPQHREWQREWVSDVEKAQPRYIVFFNHGISLFVQPNTDDYVFKWANEYLTKNYRVVGLADMVDGMQTNYVWKESLAGYQPKGQNVIYVYERNQQ